MNDYDVRRAFERIELELIESMKRNLAATWLRKIKEGFRWNMWQEEQLKSLKAYQRANRRSSASDSAASTKKSRTISAAMPIMLPSLKSCVSYERQWIRKQPSMI